MTKTCPLYREKRSWHLSVLFETVQLFQELLFNLVLHQCPPKFPTNSNKCQNLYTCRFFCSSFEHNLSLKGYKNEFFFNFQIFLTLKLFVKCQNLVITLKVSQRSKLKVKSKGQNHLKIIKVSQSNCSLFANLKK